MSEFDPYYKWLAIPPAEQPPHHYRLLGLVLFEADADVISAAADRQMSHVRSYQHGPHSDRSQHLLNEISNARVTLLRPETKAQYDAQLRARLGPAPGASPAPHPAPQPAPQSASGTVAPAARPAPSQKPLKVAAPLHAATPLRQAQPLPQGGQAGQGGQGPAHPQPMPQAARPAPQSQPVTAAIVEDPVMVGDKPSPEGEPAPDRRRGKKQKGLVGMIAGVVGGGIMGTYLAGIILNCLGAPIPDAVRFLPGMGEGKQVAVKPEENGQNGNNGSANRNNNNGGGNNNNAGNNNSTNNNNTNNGQSGRKDPVAVPAGNDLWKLSPAQGARLQFAAGRHNFAYVEDGKPYFADTNNHDSGVAKSTISLGDGLLHSENILTGYEQQLHKHYLYAKPGTSGNVAIPMALPPGMQIAGRVCYVNCLVLRSPPDNGAQIELVLTKSLRRDTVSYDPGDVLNSQVLDPGGHNRPVNLPSDLREFYLVFNIKNVASPGAPPTERGMRLMLQPDVFKVTFQVEPAGGTFAATNNNNGNNNNPASGGTYTPVQPGTSDSDPSGSAAKWPIPDARQVAAELIRLQGRNNNDPLYWIQAAESESTPLNKYSMLNLATKRAVDAGDVQQLAYAYDRMEASFSADFAVEQASLLTQLADGKKGGFQPAAFASFSAKVLQKMRSKGELSRHKGLLSSALGWAREARDYDSLRELTLLAAEVQP